MHLRNAELFCDVVVQGSFSKAAEVRRVSQSAASQAVHALEKRLGAQLIDRSKRPFEVTPAGKIYFDGCQQLLKSFELVEEQVRRAVGQTKNRVRIAAIYSVGLAQMYDYVEHFQQLYPDVMITLDYLHPDEVYQRVCENQADLGLVSFPKKEDKELTSILWQEQPMVLVVHPGHPLADRESCTVSEIEDEPFVAFTSELVVRQKIDRWLRKAGVHVQLIHEFDNIENIKRAVEAEAGIAVLPLPTVTKEVQDQSLKVVRLEQVEWFRPIGIIQRKQKSIPDVVSKFIEILHEDPANFSIARRESTETSASERNQSSSMDAFSFGPLIARE